MKKHFRKVLEVLKTRKEIKALGFSRKELKGVAAKIADKLDLKDDATEEEVTDAIDDAIDAALPYLEVSQTVADRRLQAYKDAHPEDGDEDEDEDDDPNAEPEDGKGRKSPSKGKKGNKSPENNSELKDLLNGFTETIKGLKDEIAELKSGKTADSRKARLEKILKDTGKFGERTLKSFARMTFKDDEEFEDYLDEVEADLEAENQERGSKGLETLGKPAGAVPGKSGKKDGEDEVLSDDEVKALAHG